MSVGGMMRTSVSGMSAQASRLGAVSDNIANSNTNGYKQSEVEFSSLVLPSTGGQYNSGAVESHIRTLVSEQGGLIGTGNNKNADKIDLAISGNGFLVVGDGNGGSLLTRAGSFTKQNDGTLVNAAGYTLQGYPIGTSGTTSAVINGFAGLQDVNLQTGLLSANPTTEGMLTVPLNKAKIAGLPGTSTQSTYFASSGGSSIKGDQLTLTISVDGATAIPVTVTSTGLTGINSISGTDIVAAINKTTGLQGVASLDDSGRLVLKSNSGNIGSASSIQLISVAETASVPGTYAQSAAFSSTGGTSVQGDKLLLNIKVDGGSSIPVTVTSTGTGGINSITPANIVTAINSTIGLSGVASLDGSGNLVLKSNSANVGTASTIQLVSVAQTNSAGVALGTPTTLAGLTAGTGSVGTTGGAMTSPTNLNGLSVNGLPVAGTTSVLPSDNTLALPSGDSTISTSLTVYDNSGKAVKLDFYYTKVDDTNNVWEMTVFDSSKAATGTATSPFPYGFVGAPPLAKATMTFDSSTYTLSSLTADSGGSAASGTFNIDLGPIGGSTFKLDLSHTTQFTGTTPPLAARVNGNPAEVIDKISISKSGTVTAVFTSGTKRDLYDIPMAKVNSPNGLTQEAGNAFSVGIESGTVLMGVGSEGGFGDIIHGSLEESTVDLAGELTTMIEAQRSYTANSKVFQTGSEILDVLVNLKR